MCLARALHTHQEQDALKASAQIVCLCCSMLMQYFSRCTGCHHEHIPRAASSRNGHIKVTSHSSNSINKRCWHAEPGGQSPPESSVRNGAKRKRIAGAGDSGTPHSPNGIPSTSGMW